MAILTQKRRAFVHEYVVDWNATQAAKRAGYSAKTAYQAGARLLKDVEIAHAIAVLRDSIESDRIMSATEMAERLTAFARRKATDFIDSAGRIDIEAEGVDSTAVVSLDVTESGPVTTITKVRLVDPLRAMDQLAKLKGYVAPVVTEISGPGGQPITIQPITEEQAIERYAAALQRAGVRALAAGADDTGNG
jgi:phage terminase small subunit